VCGVVDRNTLQQGAVRGRPPRSAVPQYVSAVVGERCELKWNVAELVSRPGLRRDVLLHDAVTELGTSPWRYAGAPHCRPLLYGYRGQLLDWDFAAGVYRVNAQDDASFTDELTVARYDDFHRLYAPYYRLVGAPAMRSYLQATAAGGKQVRLAHYLVQLSDDAGYSSGAAVMPAYRPLERAELALSRDVGPMDAPRQLLRQVSGGGAGGDVRRAKSCVTQASRDRDDDVFERTCNDNFLAVSHVQQTGV